MKVLIIEDEALAANRLKQLLHQWDEKIQTVAVIESVEGAVQWLSSQPAPDLIFLDIQLDDGICFEIFEAIEIEIPVIFTTAYDQYAIRAFKVNSVDYLLKPISKEALAAAMDKYRAHFSPKPAVFADKLNELYRQLVTTYKTRFFVKAGTHFQSIPTGDIACFFIEERCTFLRTLDGKRYAMDSSLEQVQRRLDPICFFRINRDHIIHIDAIADIITYSTHRLKIKLSTPGTEELVVSRNRVPDFKKWLDR
jgi:DNA-binding LytR/AlgR family response regulator